MKVSRLLGQLYIFDNHQSKYVRKNYIVRHILFRAKRLTTLCDGKL